VTVACTGFRRQDIDQFGELMIAKCANPSCGTFFRYLRGGKLFLLERPPIVPKSGPPTPEEQFRDPGSHDEYFWLCEKCAKIMTIASEESGAAIVVAQATTVA
jgi:hypothetical protein